MGQGRVDLLGDATVYWGALFVVVEVWGLMAAFQALQQGRSPQGTIAWTVSLVMVPLLSLPLYFLFGRDRFEGYAIARRRGCDELNELAKKVYSYGLMFRSEFASDTTGVHTLEHLARLRFTAGNRVDLLVDGQQTFDAIFEAFDKAQSYLLVQFYIVHDDEIGREFKRRLIAQAARGIRVYFLYDEFGCLSLPQLYLDELTAAGIDVVRFETSRRTNRFQVNFRNHRKVVVADGKVALLGGINVGDEYLGRDKRYGSWRDTHLAITGPAAQGVQLAFVEDWFWNTRSLPELDWKPAAAPVSNTNVLVLPTGPADAFEACELFFIHLINTAKDRIWIATPYFVPSSEVIQALRLASLRGVKVRILLPERPEQILVYLSAFSYLQDIEDFDIEIYRYQKGFMHHKAMLVDDSVVAMGTANFDNRSFRLNFEITAVIVDDEFAARVRAMFDEDLAHSRVAGLTDLRDRPWWFRLGVAVSRLFSPIQ